jgi:alpha-mannosidase
MSHFYPEIHMPRIGEVQKRLTREIVIEHVLFAAEFAVTPEPVPFAKRRTLAYKPILEGATWGQAWDCGWFHLKARVPKAWAGSYVTAKLDFSGESLVFDGTGDPIVGLTNGSVFDAAYSKDIMHLLPKCKGGEAVDLWVETGASTLFGVERCGDPAWLEDQSRIHGKHTGRVVSIRLCRFDYEKWQLWIDLQVLESLMQALPEKSARRMQVLRGVSQALDLYATHGTRACREALKPVFAVRSDPATVDVYGVGHAHIDTAWLWPFRETIRKCGRTFASQIGLIKRYPGYVFGASQAQLYAYTKQHYPSLYAKIKRAVADGRWEVQGGMWVEADCNLISGESMVRQFVHGKNFFREEFGVDVKNLWLPDVFGYSGNLPQILRKAGMPYFLTQKMSWNRYNKFPHNTFIWRGIDGSEVLAHFPPEDDYNSRVMPEALCKNESNNQERGLVQEALCLFGIGDGGGGPKEEHIERALRLRDLNGSPRFHFGHAQRVLEKMATYRPELATWCGELYFELHRATLTTQAGVKRWNRRAEEALRAAEMLCAAAGLEAYPLAALDRLWKTTLTNQFHDIIPGSSIHRVYEETIPMLQDVVAQARALEARAARRLLVRSKRALTVFNPSTEGFAAAVKLPAGWGKVTAADGTPVPVQREAGGVVAWVQAPGKRFVTLARAAGRARPAVSAPAAGRHALVLENAQVRYEFNASMQLVRAFDKEAAVEAIPAGEPGNRLDLFDDHPNNWDAWDIDEYYARQRLDDARVESVARVAGEVRSGLLAVLRVGGASTIRQQIWLGREGKRLDFVTEVDWNESHRLLRVAFPTTIRADKASSEIQYGHVQRSTADNTKWDYAQFECVGHRYADLSRHDYGVALLNDSKYGYRVKGHTLELSLLRAPTDPDPVADIGVHSFTYSFLPHTGDLVASGVRAQAAVINQGVDLFDGFAAADAALPVAVSGEGIDLAVIKRAEKEDCLVVRVVESRGVAARGELVCASPKAKIVPTDLMEWHDVPAGKAVGRLALHLQPFEIQTYKVRA